MPTKIVVLYIVCWLGLPAWCKVVMVASLMIDFISFGFGLSRGIENDKD